jgi:hypothetical protein
MLKSIAPTMAVMHFQRMKAYLRSILILIFVTGCATTHTGEFAKPGSENRDVVISIDRNGDLSDRNYIFYEYTIENKSNSWRQVQVVDVSFEEQQSEILTDDKLKAWIEGAELKLKASRFNQSLLLGSMAAVGGVLALTSRNSDMQSVGLVAMAGSTGAAMGSKLDQASKTATGGQRGSSGSVHVPQSHVFVPTQVAPESYVRRWVVIGAPDGSKSVVSKGHWLTRAKLNTRIVFDGAKHVDYSAMVQGSARKP